MLISGVLFLSSILHLCRFTAGITEESIERLRQLIQKIPDNRQIILNPPSYLKYLTGEQFELIKEICPGLTSDYVPSGITQLISKFELNVDVQLFVIADVLAQAMKIYVKSHEAAERRKRIIEVMQEKRQEREEKNRILQEELQQVKEEIERLKERNAKELENLDQKFQSEIQQQKEEFQKREKHFQQEQEAKEKIILGLQRQLEQILQENERLGKEVQENNGFILASEQMVKKTKFHLQWWKLLLIGVINLFLSLCVVFLYRRHVNRKFAKSFN